MLEKLEFAVPAIMSDLSGRKFVMVKKSAQENNAQSSQEDVILDDELSQIIESSQDQSQLTGPSISKPHKFSHGVDQQELAAKIAKAKAKKVATKRVGNSFGSDFPLAKKKNICDVFNLNFNEVVDAVGQKIFQREETGNDKSARQWAQLTMICLEKVPQSRLQEAFDNALRIGERY